jgi:Family of unknown function (DUF6665)
MSLRPPQNVSSGLATEKRVESGWSVLERELKAEQASHLGRLAGEVEKALATLRNAADGDPAGRSTLLHDAAQAVWRYFVQREACGITSHEHVIETYAIPKPVLARLGVGSGAPKGDASR